MGFQPENHELQGAVDAETVSYCL